MRFLHIADLHIGKQVNGFSLIEDQRFVLGQVIALAKEHQVAAVVLAGDIYDKPTSSEEAVSVLDWFVLGLTQANITVIGIPGNHDSAERLAFAQRLLARQGFHLPPVFEGAVPKVTLTDQQGPVNFWLLPYVRPIDVRRALPQAEVGQSYTAAVQTVLAQTGIDPSQRNVIVSHQFVTAGSSNPERATEELNLGGVDNVDVSVYRDFDYVALGHVHRPQRIGRDTARYAGSPLKYSFGEARYPKSAVLVALGEKPADQPVGECVSVELLPLSPLHDMREIKGPLADLIAPEVVAQGDTQDYLHVILTDETPHIDALARVRSVYPNVMLLDYENATTTATAEASPIADPEAILPWEAFGEFFAQQAGHPLTQEQNQLVEQLLKRDVEGGKGGTR